MIGSPDNTQPLPSNFWESVKRSDFIHLLPFTSSYTQLSSFYNSLDAFVLPAHWEGFGNVLIEAAFHGVPIITSNTTGCIDAVNPSFNSILVPPFDVDSLQTAIVSLFKDLSLRRKLSSNSRSWALKFDRVLIAQYWLEFYDSLSLD